MSIPEVAQTRQFGERPEPLSRFRNGLLRYWVGFLTADRVESMSRCSLLRLTHPLRARKPREERRGAATPPVIRVNTPESRRLCPGHRERRLRPPNVPKGAVNGMRPRLTTGQSDQSVAESGINWYRRSSGVVGIGDDRMKARGTSVKLNPSGLRCATGVLADGKWNALPAYDTERARSVRGTARESAPRSRGFALSRFRVRLHSSPCPK
jgi:hypothetical protein